MKRIFSILAIVVITAGMLRADDIKPVNTKGSWALMFSFQGISAFSPIGGLFAVNFPASFNVPIPVAATGIGMRYFLSDNMALRGGLGIAMLGTSTPNPLNASVPNGGSGSNSTLAVDDNTTSSSLIGLQAIAEWHMNGLGNVTPYLGAGLGLQMASYDTKNFNSSNASTENKSSTTQFNILGCAGFQWFFANRMSLGGEYQLGLGLVSGSTTTTNSAGSNTTDNPSVMTINTTAYSPAFNNAFSVILSMYP